MKRYYIREILKVMRQIDDPVVLVKILTAAKTHLAILNGEV